MSRTITGDDPGSTVFFTDVGGDLHQNGASYFGAEGTEGMEIKAVIDSGTISVTIPSIGTQGYGGTVAQSLSALTFACAVGDSVEAIPLEALPTNCVVTNAYVTATDTVTVVFQAVGGTVTGAAKNFKFLIRDLT